MQDSTSKIEKELQDILFAKIKLNSNSGKLIHSDSGECGSSLEDLKLEASQLIAFTNINIDQITVKSYGGIKGLFKSVFKRIVRKSTYWLFQKLFIKISNFNFAIVSLLNKLIFRIDDIKKENEQITNEKISKFESKYLETNKKINDIGDEFLNLKKENEQITNEKISKFESKYLETNKKINDIGDE
ncbi:MAG: hypothetical protein ACI8WT_004188, partial [Clostridium sp.]